MLSSVNTNNNNKKISSSASKSSSSSSSPSQSPFSTNYSLISNPRRKTMEEVWKDINLTPFNDNPTSREELGGLIPKNHRHHNTYRGINLQDFLARPFDKEPPKSVASSTTSTGDVRLFAPPAPPPPTVLCLNSGPEFHYLDNNADPSLISPFDTFASSSAFSNFCKKRVPETEDNSGDRRHKRMIKNRESAARSRARKQAYTSELELKLTQLAEENNMLKLQQERLYLAASALLPKKHTLHRTSTAPF